MVCPLCGTRRARRGCPALGVLSAAAAAGAPLGQQICAVCCGTKRLVQIPCPADCAYLATAREHPPAVAIRQQQRDVELLVHGMRDLSERQSQLFFLINSFLQRYEPPELQPLIDDDVIEAVAALAGTFETAVRGVIYEHRPAALPADRLATALKPVIAEAGMREGGRPAQSRAYLDLLGRVLQDDTNPDAGGEARTSGQLRLIMP